MVDLVDLPVVLLSPLVDLPGRVVGSNLPFFNDGLLF